MRVLVAHATNVKAEIYKDIRTFESISRFQISEISRFISFEPNLYYYNYYGLRTGTPISVHDFSSHWANSTNYIIHPLRVKI